MTTDKFVLNYVCIRLKMLMAEYLIDADYEMLSSIALGAPLFEVQEPECLFSLDLTMACGDPDEYDEADEDHERCFVRMPSLVKNDSPSAAEKFVKKMCKVAGLDLRTIKKCAPDLDEFEIHEYVLRCSLKNYDVAYQVQEALLDRVARDSDGAVTKAVKAVCARLAKHGIKKFPHPDDWASCMGECYGFDMPPPR